MLLENFDLSLTFILRTVHLFIYLFIFIDVFACSSNGADLLQFFPGIKTEGILRQAADVDDVENRIREYEQGLLPLN